MGCTVDMVSQVLRIPEESLQPAPETLVVDGADYIVGFAKLEGRLMIVLDIDTLLDPGTAESHPQYLDRNRRARDMKVMTEQKRRETAGLQNLQTIAVVNQKGGVGKTSLAMNLAWFLDTAGGRTMVLDADPQRSATRWAEAQNGGWSVAVRGIDAERDIAVVSHDIERLASEAGAEFVVLDCPPELRNAAEVALLLADVSLIPVTPSPLDIWAAEAAVALASNAQRVRGNGRPRVALVPNRLIRNTLMARELPTALSALGETVAPGITERVVVAESAIVGQTVPEYSPNSPAYGEFSSSRDSSWRD